MEVKASLHIHVQGDPTENIKYSGFQLLDLAQARGFEVIAFTCHDKVVYSKDLAEYANFKGIVLIPGIEKTIQGKHVIILNATPETEQIQTFMELKKYKSENPNCFILAPHPFHIFGCSLGYQLIKYINLFDGIEFNYFYNWLLNPNIISKFIAKKYNKPLIGTSDVHMLEYFSATYSTIQIQEKNLNSILNSLKSNKVEITTKSFSVLELIKLILKLFKAVK
jgi:predicted metal-dependent phosphoesterase TrpH